MLEKLQKKCLLSQGHFKTSWLMAFDINLCIGSIPLLDAISIVNAKRNRNKFLANVETRKSLQLV